MQKRLPQFTSHHILFLLIGMCFYYTPIKAQFTNLGPTGSSTYTTASGSGSGTGQIHCFGIPPGYQFGGLCPNSANVVFAASTYGGLWKSTNGGQNWNVVDAVQHLPINSVNDIAFNNSCPNYTMYIATGGTNYHDGPFTCGIYKSVDFGSTFTLLSSFNTNSLNKSFNYTDGRIISKIAVSPINPNYIFVATSEGLFRSTDAGATWQFVFSEPRPNDDIRNIWSVECSPSDVNTVYCSGKEVYKSTALGASGTWALMSIPISATRTITPIDICDNDNLFHPSTYTFIGKRNINIRATSNTNGTDKLFANIYTTYSYTIDPCGDPVSPPSVIAINDVYAYNNNAWTLLTKDACGYRNGIEFDLPTQDRLKIDIMPSDNNKIVAGYVETRATSNNGVSWNIATPYGTTTISHGDIHAVKFFPTGDSVLIGTDGGVYKYYMNSQTYREQNYGLSISHILDMSVSPNKRATLAIGKQDTNVDWFNGQNWTQTNIGGDGYPPVLWDRIVDSVFYCMANSLLFKYNADLNTKNYIGASQGCFEVGGLLFQNPNPYRKDEIYENKGKAITVSNQTEHATNFTMMDNSHENDAYTPAYRGMFVSKGDPDLIYVWNYVFNPPYDNQLAVKIHRERYTVGTSGVCNPGAVCTGICDSILKVLPLVDYTTTVASTSYLPEIWNSTPISQYFPVSGIVSSNTNPNKLWACIDNNMSRIKDVLTPYPSHTIFQIRKSTNRGIDGSWTDDNSGLPSLLPITNLLYIDGSNDGLICATNTGRVFYKDASMASWQELDVNLPHTPIKKLEFNYCQRKLYVASYGRGVWVYDFSNGTPALSAMQISGNVVWSGKILDIGADIDILPGASLTISNYSQINMGKGTKIIIEGDYGTTGTGNAGKLIIDNATITNSCGENWNGIYVYGNTAKPQIAYGFLNSSTSSFQGRCVLNSAVIENMQSGIVLGHLTDATKKGGQLYAINSTFRNNITAVNQLGYIPPVSSATLPVGYVQNILQSCSLIVNKTLAANPTEIIIQNSKGFQLRGNIFENQTTIAAGTARGIAIWGIEAIAEIVPLQYFIGTNNVIQKNRISGFNYGVSFGNTVALGDATHCLKIGNTVFSNNAYGIYIYGVNNATLVLDSITIPQYPKVNLGTMQAPLFVNVPAYGIYLAGCSGYKVQGNTISSSSSTYNCNGCFPQFNTGPAYGIVANNGSSLNETIRKNVLTKCNYGLTAVGLNGSTANGTGLLWQCDDLVQSQNIDIWLAENVVNGVTSTGVLKPQQGDYFGGCIAPFSANLFHEQSASIPTYNLQRNSQTETYLYRYLSNVSYPTLPYNPIRSYPTNLISKYACTNSLDYSAVCPDQINTYDWTPATSLVAHNSWLDIRERLEADEQRYLKTLIGTSDASYAELLDSITALPFVKGQVLYAAIVHPSAATQLEKLQALLLKHSGGNDSTAFYLVKAALPFSKIDVLQLQKTISSQNSTEEQAHAEMASLLGKLEGMVRAGADSLLTAHKTKEALSVLKLYSTENLDAIYAETAVSYAEKSETQIALAKLKTYPAAHANHHLAEVLEIILAQKTESNSRSNIDKAKLYQLYTNGDAAGFKAAALLANYDDTLLAPYLPEEERKKEVVNAATSLWDKVSFVEKASLTVYPKPANSSVTILCSIPKSTAITIEITDAKGALVYKEKAEGETVNLQVETAKWQSGVYLVKATSSDFSQVKSDKFVITH